MPNFELSILVFLQLAGVLLACRLVGLAARLIGQPQVVGEMIAGVLIGPSLLGNFFPGSQELLFPAATRPVLYCLAQIGLVLYMFVVGVEFRADLLFARLRGAAAISAAGIAAPFALGAVLALFLVNDARMFTERVTVGHAVLFVGAAMSITAFPMLARIIVEQRLTGTTIGTLALAAGSMDDAAAWCILALVVASFTDNYWLAGVAIGGGALYAAFTLGLLPFALRPLARFTERQGHMTQPVFATILILLMAAAWLTDRVGIYAVFGAFILGAAIPRGRLAEELRRCIEPLTVCLLLPIFFVYSGLNTRITLVDTPALWGVALLVLAAACAGKYIACALAARVSGETTRDALAIGALMNARGLMELILLNIGLERGLITPTLFSIMVMMAIVTTLMATPLFELCDVRRRPTGDATPQPEAAETARPAS